MGPFFLFVSNMKKCCDNYTCVKTMLINFRTLRSNRDAILPPTSVVNAIEKIREIIKIIKRNVSEI